MKRLIIAVALVLLLFSVALADFEFDPIIMLANYTCEDIDSLVIGFVFDGGITWTRVVAGDSIAPCAWQKDTTVSSAEYSGALLYAFDTGAVVAKGVINFNIENPENYKGASVGDGDVPCSLWVRSTTDPYPLIQGATIDVKTASGQVRKGKAVTGASGLRVFTLSETDFDIYVSHNNFTAVGTPESDDLTITGASVVDTLWMDEFDPGSPSAANLAIVYGYFYTADGVAIENAVMSLTPIVNTDTLLAETGVGLVSPDRPIEDYTNSSGYAEVEVIPSSGYEVFTQYKLKVYRLGVIDIEKTVTIPDQDNVNVDDL